MLMGGLYLITIIHLNMETLAQQMIRDIKVDEVSLRLENLFYQLDNRPNGQQVEIERKIEYNKTLYHILTGQHYVYKPLRREAA